MKLLCSFMLFLATALVISSCQKEFSSEAGLAKGTLAKDAFDECMPITVTGSYKKDILLTQTTNYVDVQVNFTQAGNYYIKTDTLNGYTFSAAGIAAVTGLNTVRLLASGKPIAPALDVFTVRYDTSVCQFDIVVTGTAGGATAAVFTLTGSPTTCTGATQTNNFFATVLTTAANTITINADVTVAGSYTIQATTSPANGLTFTASGNLAVGTNQPIVLQAVGTASTAGSIPYTLSTTAPASNCGFNVTVQAAPVASSTYTFECPSNPIFVGTYQAGVSTAGNTVTINVTSIAGGPYTITTNTTASSNGVTYVGSGVLAASPNPQSVTLVASGTPTAAGPFTYTLTGTGVTSTCTFTQTYSPATANATISFNIGTVLKTFNFATVADSSVMASPAPGPPGNFFILQIEGDAAPSSQESFYLGVAKLAPYFSNGSTYNVNQFLQSTLLEVAYTDNTGGVYRAETDGTTQTPAFSITITNITPTQVTGTFAGPLRRSTGATITVTNGAFSLPLQ
ncbi:MAG: hypothetical protein ACKVOM_02615 [Ferruginibacter sp.]